MPQYPLIRFFDVDDQDEPEVFATPGMYWREQNAPSPESMGSKRRERLPVTPPRSHPDSPNLHSDAMQKASKAALQQYKAHRAVRIPDFAQLLHELNPQGPTWIVQPRLILIMEIMAFRPKGNDIPSALRLQFEPAYQQLLEQATYAFKADNNFQVTVLGGFIRIANYWTYVEFTRESPAIARKL
ncbi:hypothetical protein AcW2_004123 [Taiwanofungus camphoratus]|nr:hypothetical protein AcW2_004123 [Antrodia cinnamomea]